MQVRNRADLVTQRRHLTDHVHAFSALALVVDLNIGRRAVGVGRVSPDALRRNPQPPEIEHFERFPNFLFRTPLFDEPPLLAVELLAERGTCAPGGMADSGFEQDRLAAGERLTLETLDDGARRNGLASKQVAGSEQDANPHTFFSKRRRQRRDHRGRQPVVDASCEDHVIVRGPIPASRPDG